LITEICYTPQKAWAEETVPARGLEPLTTALQADAARQLAADDRQRRRDGCDLCRSRQLAAGFRGQTLGQTHGLEDQQRYATLWAMKDTAGGGQDNTAA
jgi:hypothetical protein